MKENKTIKKNKMKRADELYKFYNLTSFCLFVFLLKEENNKKKWGLYILYSILQYFRGLLQDLDLGISSPSSDGKVREKIHRHPSRPPTFTKIHSNFNSQSGPPLSRGVAPKWDAKNKFKTAVCYVFKFCLFSEDGHQGKVMRETMEK